MCRQTQTTLALKAIIPAAGLGTRFLPISRYLPKEMLPINNLPAMQLILEELLEQGIQNLNLVISPAKKLVLDYAAQFCLTLLVKPIIQKTPLGLGHAVLQAMLDRPEAKSCLWPVLLPDNLFAGAKKPLEMLLSASKAIENCCAAILLVPVEPAKTSQYGIAGLGNQPTPGIFELTKLIEKPLPQDSPSNLAIMGRYLFSGCIVEHLKALKPGVGGELQLTDAINSLILSDKKVLGVRFDGDFFDLGNPEGWLQTNNYFAQNHLTKTCLK